MKRADINIDNTLSFIKNINIHVGTQESEQTETTSQALKYMLSTEATS